ncbi:ubiquinol-cytochrome c reductase, putative [Theileria equi strain WA]|uniref:Ubiquinol-cytochrome c reductase, putative n=1 Tax=Theileria equi strain WA TaxID=1537102 RepID=L0B2N6_THEEQ|nr:ubiquinol-cytochrome c reductase, putative [Theileria equi strain WA]AFZ81748.1 ubiquinol-cytochrome c reductase, putative [Theileria equi strain WA]|eukprot:XP_004831414.1 ubiquinol-cytochrome c reductase, putative [Theileria equi strain WA]
MSRIYSILSFRRQFASTLHHEMKKSSGMPAASERPLYRNAFDRADNPKLWLKDTTKYNHPEPVKTLGDLLVPHGHGHLFGNSGSTRYAHYVNVWEPTFPKTPDLSKGELISGANFTRTSGWHFPGEPAIVSVGKLGPANQRAVGYAENAAVPESISPDAFPDFREYRIPNGADRRATIYLMTATVFFFIMAFARTLVCKLIHYFWLSRDVAASGALEVNVGQMLPGDQVTVKWRSKPVFIRRRTPEDIARAKKDDELLDSMRDPELDEDRNKNPEWLINIGICTHLGCIPTKGGNYGGFFCPCHGSHYDGSGRIRQGPAPANLEVPPYRFIDDNTIRLG